MVLARNAIYEAVRRDIVSCLIPPGSEVRESELAHRFGVSKSPVRDALQKLETEGLIEIEARRGHRVRAISVREAEDVLELRQIIEEACVKKVAQVASTEELASLDQYRQADRSSIRAFAAYNWRFHCSLGVMSQNRRIAEEAQRTMEFYGRLCLISLSAAPNRGFDASVKDHAEIIDALQARDGSTAARLVRRHLGKSRSQILKALGNRPIIA